MKKSKLPSKLFALLFAIFLANFTRARINMLINDVSPISGFEYLFPISQLAWISASVLTIIFILAYVLEPNYLTKLIEKFSSLDLKKNAHGIIYTLLCGSFWLIFGSSLFQGISAFETRFILNKPIEFGAINQISVLTNQSMLLIPFVIIPVFYMIVVNEKSYKKTLGLYREDLLKNVFLGIVVGVFILFAVGIVNYVLIQLFGLSQENMLLNQIARLGPLFALFVSFLAGFSEEIFFRGFLQKKLGILITSFLFAITHTGYGILIQITGPFVFGLIIGYAYKKSENLVVAITAHTTLNLIVILARIYSMSP